MCAQPSEALLAALSKVKAQLGLKTLQSVLVVHCAHAYAAVLEGEAGWKVAFSGDTRPCDQMVAAAQDATLLIHEASHTQCLSFVLLNDLLLTVVLALRCVCSGY